MLSISSISIQGQEEQCAAINIILGANNTGKSTFLRELHEAVYNVNIHPTTVSHWINGATLKRTGTRSYSQNIIPGTFNRPFDVNNGFKTADFSGFKENIGSTNNYTQLVYDLIRQSDDSEHVYKTKNVYSYPENVDDQFNALFSNLAVSIETTSARLTANFQTTINDVGISPSQDMMHHLLTHPSKLAEINDHVKKVFSLGITFDNLQQGNKMLRIKPSSQIQGATNLKETAAEWNQKSPLISNQGDGIKAYLKILFGLLEPSNEVIFIDEPEAFLHPPQRRELGRLVAELARSNNKQVFIATHDSEFLGGLMSISPSEAKVFYLKGEPDGKIYSSYSLADIKALTTRASNFVSERILQSFFYRKTILCEDENDRAFYEIAAVNYFNDRVQNINFVGLSGKGDVIKIQRKLRSLGLRCGFIVDFDFLLDSDCPYDDTPLLSTPHNRFRAAYQRGISRRNFKREDLKFGGLKFLKQHGHQRLLQLAIEAISAYENNDIYIVPNGEFESFTGGSSNLKDAIPFIQLRRRSYLAQFLKKVLTV